MKDSTWLPILINLNVHLRNSFFLVLKHWCILSNQDNGNLPNRFYNLYPQLFLKNKAHM